MEEKLIQELAAKALAARKHAYAPYSHFCVGAALLCEDGTVFTGCNIENAAYPVGICAERTAFAKAISEGYRSFTALAIAGAADERSGSDRCSPCGLCRQFIREFAAPDFPILVFAADEDGTVTDYTVYSLAQLLPDSFGPDALGR